MNANEISSKPNARLKRIQKITLAIRILIGLAVVSVVAFVSISFVEPRRIGFFPFSKYASIHAVPAAVLILGFIRAGLFLAGAFVLNRLLRIFAKGDFFTVGNITCIKWLGGLVIADWLIVKLLDAIVSRVVAIGVGDFTKLAFGLLIILIAWIMDEGRKIQEEQELTV